MNTGNHRQFFTQAQQLLKSGQRIMASESLAKAIAMDPSQKVYKVTFLKSVISIEFPNFNTTLKQALMECLQDPYLRHRGAFTAWLSQVRADPALSSFAALDGAESYEEFCNIFDISRLSRVLSNEFLILGLKRCLCNDVGFEYTLTFLRRYLLLELEKSDRKNLAPFIEALAIQCFLNEHVFFVTEEEEEALKKLDESCEENSDYMLLACYQNLHTRKAPKRLSKTLTKDYPEAAKLLLDEPLEEKKIKKALPSFGSIKDKTSQYVRKQYERHPYPRWLHFGGGEVNDSVRNSSKGLEILAAGCGTGLQTAGLGKYHPFANITAIDLSRSSLSYAKRKATEYGFNNITFMHGDILEVKEIGKQFDFIASGGVIHHMKSPKAGAEALLSVLKPGGMMRLALYSEIGRRDVVDIQKWAFEKGYKPTDEDVRAFRHDLFQNAPELYPDGVPNQMVDMSTTSECMDTYLPAEEHRYTCLTMKEFLDDLGLECLEFARGRPYARAQYAEHYPEDSSLTNLENWHQYETENPNTFLGMYRLMVARKDEHTPGDLPEPYCFL